MQDDQELARLGKKQALTRRFGFWSLFGFAVCELITWETVLALFSEALYNGGPSGMVYGFVLAWASTLSVYTVISELASLAPIAAGQYYWAYILSPARARVFVSYLIGWLTSLAWIATVATESLFAGTMLQGLLVLSYDSYVPTDWQATLLTWMVIMVSVFINTVIPTWLPRLEIATVVFHLAGFVAVLATLWVCTPSHRDASWVFTASRNGGGWSSLGISYCVGFMGNVATFVGADASVHLAEEVSHPAETIPRVITASMLLNGVVGFVMVLAVAFCLSADVSAVLDSSTGFPFLQVFADSLPASRAGAVVLGAVVLLLTWACANGITTSASRMTWAFARDSGVPFAQYIRRVHPRHHIPIIAVGVVATFACLLSLIYIGSPTVFNDVISLTVAGFYGSYLVPAALLLYHRVRGNILPHNAVVEAVDVPDTVTPKKEEQTTVGLENTAQETEEETAGPNEGSNLIAYAPGQLYWGPWHLPGIWGTLNNAYACAYMVFVIFWSAWPVATPVSPATMNYGMLVTVSVLLFSLVWYVFRGRRYYRGPLVEREVLADAGVV
ncbi:hypothetical protein ASPZODRAFT_136388 [Penicilliopsis zonata CBS 506.65]|uniref:Amino acid permease/ SLC12A domain-containing protein n=1 Tax=Penicilliopsis zonata CBS 506.65 TaxID=1073090 RepID=A0A1L9S7R6_9EURO|nr:hypothetical protein ASPZODRAFT_136388 [Penicilliopsis zonata CBS 506.65]OJJ43195.1 hypothetical protein ASPZODRAFT_136388 [Penicilliopsis zonata CBS 506.65]